MIWKRQWFDSTSAAGPTFNVGQCIVMVRGTSLLYPENYLLFSHVSRPPIIQGAMLICNSMLTTPAPGAPRWAGRVLADEAKRPKPGSRNGFAYFDTLTLFES